MFSITSVYVAITTEYPEDCRLRNATKYVVIVISRNSSKNFSGGGQLRKLMMLLGKW